MTAPKPEVQIDFDPDTYTKCGGLDVKVDAVNQYVYLAIDRGLELPVRVAVPFDAVCMLAAAVLQVIAVGVPNGNGG